MSQKGSGDEENKREGLFHIVPNILIENCFFDTHQLYDKMLVQSRLLPIGLLPSPNQRSGRGWGFIGHEPLATNGVLFGCGECFKQLPPNHDSRNTDDAGSAARTADGTWW